MHTGFAAQSAPRAATIDPATRLGLASLAVANGERSLAFYRDVLGFAVLENTAGRIVLGAGATPLLELLVQPGLRPRPRRTTGLYHVAILLPTRLDLAYALKRIIAARIELGASDHLVSEALYVSDPDGNGLEIYRDRPRAEWRRQPNGQLAMDTLRLNLADVLAEIQRPGGEAAGLPAGTTVGHMHLQVGDLNQAWAFYGEVLGFELMVTYPGALFVAAGGYHHHLGLNVWESAGAPPAPADAAGLR
ncbi:MAG TPA: VOC family protein, partial [Herpetosiphonaceae bacterium]|nr:VOC family protein [Herpetosiphonaceae bacterium]